MKAENACCTQIYITSFTINKSLWSNINIWTEQRFELQFEEVHTPQLVYTIIQIRSNGFQKNE